MRTAVLAVVVVALLAETAALAGCDRSTEGIATPSPSAVTTASTPAATPTRSPARPVTSTPGSPPSRASTPVFSELTAVPCRGHPTAEQVVALLRRTTGFLPASATVTVATGPLCAGTWQYTVIGLPDRDPLQVVTKGSPLALELITAGTDICTVEVRAMAPAGIRAVTRC